MKILLSILLFFIFFNTYSQDTIRFEKEKNTNKDILIIDLYNDIWQDVPSTVNVRTINQGINVYLMINKPIRNSNISLTTGIGISSHNLYSDAIPVLGRDVNTNPDGVTKFVTLGDYFLKPVSYKINKINLTYIDIPIEIKYKTRAERKKRFNCSIGFKIGYNVSNHTKFKGEDIVEDTDDIVVIKKSNIRNISDWNYGIIARIGYGRFKINSYYSLAKIFDKGKGPQIYPISVGLSFSPF